MSAFAIAALAPVGLSLAGGLLQLDPDALVSLQRRVSDVSAWIWHMIVVPFLDRPAWLLPSMLGVVFGGLAVTIARGVGGVPRRPRR